MKRTMSWVYTSKVPARIAEAAAVRDDVGRLEGSASDDLQQLRDTPVTDYHPHVGTVGHATEMLSPNLRMPYDPSSSTENHRGSISMGPRPQEDIAGTRTDARSRGWIG
ncbi:hypothetical protein SeLEV6574_g07783 [Synchytrium endobioticum]|uniref:Uncharacterized protein n=1 Tax=Synchytrium endobioticum TaxID=286115 RepID=A0A507CBJ9_9FUNG|nr:hypothetical protein SeLEV6574_g07783 [Synchytrium endobioticum]